MNANLFQANLSGAHLSQTICDRSPNP
ncbi:pentapeptide repeat-containing protein [Thermosynechococcus sp. Uc]